MVNIDEFNKKIAKAEELISSEYHFMFHKIESEQVFVQTLIAEILQARVLTEGICRFVVLNEKIVKDVKSIRTATFSKYVNELIRPSLKVPKPIIANLSVIQEKGNLAAHYQPEGEGVSAKDVEICIEALEAVVEWFLKEYSKENVAIKKFIASDALNNTWTIPPKEEGCTISRNREIKDIRDLLEEGKVLSIIGDTGIGKTETIKDYVAKYRKEYVGTYYANSISGIDDYIYNLPIGILDEEKKTKEEIVKEKIDIIHSIHLPYLFIIDNYEGRGEDLDCIFPTSEDTYHLIILSEVSLEIDSKISQYEISPFSKEDSLCLFNQYCDSQYEDEEVTRLLSYLSYNPRAIKMSGLFLKSNDYFTPQILIGSMKANSSIKSITKNLYTVLMGMSILEKDKKKRQMAECLSLVPYNGFSKRRFLDLYIAAIHNDDIVEEVERELEDLRKAGWISIDEESEQLIINSLISDTIFEKMQPDMDSKDIAEFVLPILHPIRRIRELYYSQVIELEPFVDHLYKRVKFADACDLQILNDIREYYIAIYDIPKVDEISNLMEREFQKLLNVNGNMVEITIFRQGISRFNLESFEDAHNSFSQAISMLEEKRDKIDALIAKISAYEGSSLAAMNLGDEAIQCVSNSVSIRKKLSDAGYQDEKIALWISYYNYAKVLFEQEKYEEALEKIETSISIYKRNCLKQYESQEFDVSSLCQMKGRILAGLGRYSEGINLLEKAKDIRENLKGTTYYATAQIYSYLMDVYDRTDDVVNALKYAEQYYDVLISLYKTDDIRKNIAVIETKIAEYREKIGNDKI